MMPPVYLTIEGPPSRGGVILALFPRERIGLALTFVRSFAASTAFAGAPITVTRDGQSWVFCSRWTGDRNRAEDGLERLAKLFERE